MNDKTAAWRFIREHFVALAMVLIVTAFAFTCPNFFTLTNWLDIAKQGGILSLVALAMTMVLIVGGMDMSVGAMTDLCTNLCAGMIAGGGNLVLTMFLSVGAGLACGMFNMVMVVVVGIPSFIATVGTMFVVTGITFAYNHGQSILLRDKPVFFHIAQGSVYGIPNMAIILAVITAVLYASIRRFRFGNYMYAVGGNAQAAKAAGINLVIPQAIAYGLSGVFAGIAGVLGASYISGSFALGSSFEFLITAFAAAFLGSTIIRQGELNPLGTVISAIFISALTNALTLYGVSHLILPGIEGLVLIAALILGNWGRKEIGQMTIF